MSDAIIVAVIGALATNLGIVVTWYLNSKQIRKAAHQNSMENKKISDNVKEYHEEVNGKMGLLLEAKKAEGKAEEKSEEHERQKSNH